MTKIITKTISALISFLFLCHFSNAQCWQSISAGTDHVVAIRVGGTLWTWGGNSFGQLGTGNTTNKNTPTQVTSAGNGWQSVAAGDGFSVAIKTGGTLWAWGSNISGELGDGTNTNRTAPVQIGVATNWSSVSAGSSHVLAIKTDGTLWAWGLNDNGQLGDGTITNRNAPVKIGVATNWRSVSAGSAHSVALRTDNSMYTWGANNTGQIGDGSTTNRNAPVQIGTTVWQTASAGSYHTLAIRTNGSLWAWGLNNVGQLGLGTTVDHTTPAQIGALTTWQVVSAGSFQTIALKSTGELSAWGNNSLGELGDGTNTDRTSPVVIGGLVWQTDLSAGDQFSLGFRASTALWNWGLNTVGQLGNATNTTSNSPGAITCPTVVLPITWLSIDAYLKNNSAVIRWSTAQEVNSYKFEIEYSTDGVSFTKIGSQDAAGFSSTVTNYTFTHNNPAFGVNYYRVKQYDQNGQYSYSSVVKINNKGGGAHIILSPNPAKNILTVNFDAPANPSIISLYNTSGQLILQQQISKGVLHQNIDISKFSAGMYRLRIETMDAGLIESFSIIKQ